MRFWLGIENFAKIESARICINDYTILVGENNSGKTFLMQLVQGISRKLAYLVDGAIKDSFLVDEKLTYKLYEVNQENIILLVTHINEKLSSKKENFIKEIFGKDILIERLYIDIVLDENELYEIYAFNSVKEDTDNSLSYIKDYVADKFILNVIDKMPDIGSYMGIVRKKDLDTNKSEIIAAHGIFVDDENFIFKTSLNSLLGFDSLFLPASRNGLLLLYRDFFANRTDNEISYSVKGKRVKENKGNLTQPIYEFLRFLQTYTEEEDIREKFSDELTFFEEHLIEGHISVNKQGVFSYNSKYENESVPMYLASSMINEVAPLVLAIESQNAFDRLIIDEVEASLHPQKQMELVRFLNRLNNKGMKLILSTHSDTFVSKLNNLYILSELVKKNGVDILKQFNLEKEDLVEPEKMFVYEVVNKTNGKSIVREIKGNEETGYQFDLFTDSAMHIYDEAVKIGEIQ